MDFHSLRMSFATLLSSVGVQPRLCQELLRHSDVNLTMKAYTDPQLLNVAGAVGQLPDLSQPEKQQQQRATGTMGADAVPKKLCPNLVPSASISRQKQSFPVTSEPTQRGKGENAKSALNPPTDASGRNLSPCDMKASGEIRTHDHPLTRRELYH